MPAGVLREGDGKSTTVAWHPLVVACAAMAGVRLVGLTLHYLSNDPNGHRLYASPANALIIALPYNGVVLLTAAAVLLSLWRIAARARPLVTALGVSFAALSIVVGQVDLALQWFKGLRFVPVIATTYVGPHLLSSDVYLSLLYHPLYTLVGGALLLAGLIPIARSLLRARRRLPLRTTGWPTAALLVVAAFACRVPLGWAYGFQRDTMRPPELVFIAHWTSGGGVPAPDNADAALRELRQLVNPAGDAKWSDPQYPLVRAASGPLAPIDSASRPDILLFAVESLRGADVGYVPGNNPPGESATPRLDSLARHGVVFSRYLSSGNPSPRGFFSLQTGMLDHQEALNTTGATNTVFDALPARLRSAGYRTMAFWGSNPSFDNQLFWANKWYDRLIFPPTAARFVILRPTADDVLLDQVMAEVRAHDAERSAQPLFAYVYPVGMHAPYVVEGETNLPDSIVQRIAAERDVHRRYRLALRNLDAQFGRLLDFLSTRKTTRPLLILITGDHSDVAGDEVPAELFGLPHNALAHTALLVAGPSSLIGPVPRVESFSASHIDLMPTLLRIVGDAGPSTAMGTDLFANTPPAARTALAVNHQGFRLDRGDWSLFVRRDHTTGVYTRPIFAPLREVRAGTAGSPFTDDDARHLRNAFRTWSWLIETNRVWPASPQSAGARAGAGK